MLTKGDDYPLHQTPEPMALSGGNRNFYDRYFFNGYSADGSIFFAAALGVYPQLDIMDAAFCVSIDGKQHNLRASKRMGSERLNLTIGPITVTIVEPLQQLRLTVAGNDSPITADISFTARHHPIKEPRFIRREGPRLMMDYTRMTQNGDWSGTITIDGQDMDVGNCCGTRDRSWGIRQVGAAESQPPPAGEFPQFWWLWAPLNFDQHACFFHSNDDGNGVPWNRRGVVDAISRSATEFEPKTIDLSYHRGSRRIKQVALDTADGQLSITPRTESHARTFYMSGLGYLHPIWGHGMDHGDLEIGYDSITFDPEPGINMTTIHIQALSDAVLTVDGTKHHGIGIVEQLFIGPHAASGLTGIMGSSTMSRAMPVRPEQFEKAFVETVFSAPPGSLRSIRHEPVGTGQVCDSYRFTCDWAKAEGPDTFIAKCPSADPVSRSAAAIFHLYDMEVGWYRDVAAGSGVSCPRSYHADITDDELAFVLLLEDMAPATQGDQLAGASLVQVQTTLAAAAALHNVRPDKGFESCKWLHHSAGNSAFLENTLPKGYPVFRERFSDLLSSDILDLGQELIDRIAQYVAHEPPELTITHGDMRLDNILFHADGRVAALVDWQTCSLGNPANDAAYMIGTSFANPAERRAQEERLVADYLTARSSAPDFDAFWREYRRHAFSGFIMAINASLHVEQTARGNRMFAAMAERPAQMAIDLDSLSLL